MGKKVVNTMRTAVLLDDGFEELEAMAPIALLRRGGIDVDLVSPENGETETGRFGVTLGKTIPMEDYDFTQADCLLLPGGPGHALLEKNEKVREQIRRFAEDDAKVMAAICASPTILGRMGLLKGKNYTCFKSMNEDFGGQYQEDYAVTDGNLVTGKSAAGAIDFAFAVMEKLTGRQHTDEVKASIYYDSDR